MPFSDLNTFTPSFGDPKTLNLDTAESFQYQELVEFVPEVIYKISAKGDLVSLNPAFKRITGWNIEDWIGKSFIGLVHTEDRGLAVEKFNQTLNGEIPNPYQLRILAKSGNYIWGEFTSAPVFENGKVVGKIGLARDITRKKQNENNLLFLTEASKLLSSNLDYQRTLKNIAKLAISHISDWCVIDMINPQGRLNQLVIAHSNPKKIKLAKELRRKYPPDLTKQEGMGFVLQTGKSGYYPNITEKMLKASIKDPEYLKLLKGIGFTSVIIVPLKVNKKITGTITFVSAESKRQFSPSDLKTAEQLADRASAAIENSLLYKEANKEISKRQKAEEMVLKAKKQLEVIIQNDITQRRQADQTKDLLAAIVESSDDAIVGQTLEGIITSWNPGAEKLYGFTPREIIGQPILKIVPEDKKEEFYQIMEVARIGGSIDHLETVRKHRDSRRIDISLTLSPIVDSSGQIIGVSGISRDISVQKELERRKDAFIGMASHELKTPITTLKAFTQLLMQLENKRKGNFFKYLSKMDEELNRLAELVTELLDLSKIQVGRLELIKEKFDLDEMIFDTVENVQDITKKHKIQVDGKSEKILFGDKRRINQVLTNLLTNAIKYSPKADRVIVKVVPSNNKVTISITDFGIGIAKKHQLRIFDRFYRAAGANEKTFPGLGIGLYISSEIIERHGGRIWVESIKRKGSTFSFALPLK